MAFIADDLGAWLVGLLADAGRRKLVTFVLGDEQQRALYRACQAALEATAAELRPDDAAAAEEVAMVVGEVFKTPTLRLAAEHRTLLEELQAGIATQLAVLDDRDITEQGWSSAEALGVPAGELAAKLASRLVREITRRGVRGGLLEPISNQLGHDRSFLLGLKLEGKIDHLDEMLVTMLAVVGQAGPAPAAPVALAQLPAETAVFTGRADDLAVLTELLGPAGSAGAVVVSAVAGLAGVGKTTLAVHAAHAAVRSGWFGGGVLFLDLHGYEEASVEPGQALDALLRALGVAPEHIPPSSEERAALYRSVLAQITSPVLVVADNASSEAQVQPLLPGSEPHRVLVTSRHTLAGLGARLLDITHLDSSASVELLDVALRAARPDDDRITADLHAAARVAQSCGGLPLALQITAALLTIDTALTARELADLLADEKQLLDVLRYDDGSGVSGLSVAAAFGLSYRKLDAASARVFGLLGAAPGPDFSAETAAVLADMPGPRVRAMLSGLTHAHLIEPAPGVAGRWRLHDLVRVYAQRLTSKPGGAAGRTAAFDRLLAYWLDKTWDADAHVRAIPGVPVPRVFADRPEALAWLDGERASLIATVSAAAVAGRDQTAVRLTVNLAEYLDWRRRFDDWVAIGTTALDAARRLGDRPDEATALNNLGLALTEVRHFEEAITAHQDAAAIYRESGERHGEGVALNNLGAALIEARRFEEAITAHQDAAAIFRETRDRHYEGMALNNLGIALTEVRHFEEAITAHQDAAAIYRETGDRHHEGGALNNLGLALTEVRHFEEAITAHQDAAAIYRETGDRHGEGMAQGNLGSALSQVRRFKEAITAHQDAAEIYRETGDRHGEGSALNNLGVALRQVHRFEEAITAHQDAAEIYRETGDRHREAITLNNLGLVLAEVGRFEEAITAHQDAAAMYRETGDGHGEAMAIGNLGTAMTQVRRFEEAITAHQDAAAFFRQARDRDREGMTLINLGVALAKVGRFEEAITAHQDAAAIFRETGNEPSEASARANLDQITARDPTAGAVP